MPKREKRERIKFSCPNCPTQAWSRPGNDFVCGQCFIPLKPQFPDHYPEAMEPARRNIPTVPPAEIPLEQLALPAHIRHLLDSITETAPEPHEPEESQVPKRKSALPESVVAEADRIIRACLKADATNGSKRSGWKQQLAQKLGRHPAWVTHRVKKIQADGQAVAT